MIPAITLKFYQSLVAAMVSSPMGGAERARLAVLQRQLAEAQQELAREKILDVWVKAG